MKQIKLLFVILITTFGVSVMHSQNANIEIADEKFDNLQYIDAIRIYEDVANTGVVDQDMFRKIGDAYFFNANYISAAIWYQKVFALQSIQEPIYNFRYGQSLKSSGKSEEGNVYLQQYYSSLGFSDVEVKRKTSARNIDKHANMFSVFPVGFNTKYSDYPAFFLKDSLYVISADNTLKESAWNGQPTSDIFTAKDNGLSRMDGVLNTEFNEGSLVITNDGNTMYFTRNNFSGKKRGKDANEVTRLKLYKTIKTDGVWGDVIDLPFNSDAYSVGHPALSTDGKTLYFVSDMPGTKGGTDLYAAQILNDTMFGEIKNMTKLNTIGNEMFPFIAKDGTLYFSSNGHPNLGGLDVFMASPTPNGGFDAITNVGRPVNGNFDDFAFVFNSDSKKGYFASNRLGSNSDDIFQINEGDGFEICNSMVAGLVKDAKTGELLSNAIVTIIGADNTILDRVVTNANSQYSFSGIDCNEAKFIRAEKSGYQTNEIAYPKGSSQPEYTDILLSKKAFGLYDGADLAALLNPIYFDLDKSNIRKDAEVELQKIVAVMKQFPELKIDVRSHTDSRANDNYNMTLSESRNEATINFLVNNGINRNRLSGKGYGETKLINNCSNGVNCTEQQHQANRRSEFIVLNKI